MSTRAQNVRMELQTKRLQRIIQDAYPNRNVGAQRSKGVTTIDAILIVVVWVHGAEEPSKLRGDH
eukprot:4639631-Pyramimonas_sp.AAC.1